MRKESMKRGNKEVQIFLPIKTEKYTISSDRVTRYLFSLTDLGDELIRAVVLECDSFLEKKEIQKELGEKHTVIFDYYRQTNRFEIDLEMQHSKTSHVEIRMQNYLLYILYDILQEYGLRTKRAIAIMYLDHWPFEKDLLLKKEFPDEISKKLQGQIYFVNIHYQGKAIDSYLYRICQDFQTAESGLFRPFQTEIFSDVVKYYHQGGKQRIMSENDEIYQTGKKEGKQEGRQEGRKEGKLEQKEATIYKMCLNPKYSNAEIAEVNDVPLSEVIAQRKKLSERKQLS